jgi:hypothetical protein
MAYVVKDRIIRFLTEHSVVRAAEQLGLETLWRDEGGEGRDYTDIETEEGGWFGSARSDEWSGLIKYDNPDHLKFICALAELIQR